MNRTVLTVLLSAMTLVSIVGLFGCQPASPDTNRDAAKTANANVAKETVDSVAIEAELLKLEREWSETAKTHDPEPAKRILAEDVVMTYPDGSTGTKADEVGTIEKKLVTVESWDLLDPKVTVLNADSAFITGRGVIRNGKITDPTTKRSRDISGEYRFTDIYVKRNGKWQAIASQTTRIENPVPATAPAPPAKAAPETKASPAK